MSKMPQINERLMYQMIINAMCRRLGGLVEITREETIRDAQAGSWFEVSLTPKDREISDVSIVVRTTVKT